MVDEFEYISHARLEYRDGYRRAYLGDVRDPVVYGVQGKLREYYGAKEGPEGCTNLDSGRGLVILVQQTAEEVSPTHVGTHPGGGRRQLAPTRGRGQR
jgi:hypothetical protein